MIIIVYYIEVTQSVDRRTDRHTCGRTDRQMPMIYNTLWQKEPRGKKYTHVRTAHSDVWPIVLYVNRPVLHYISRPVSLLYCHLKIIIVKTQQYCMIIDFNMNRDIETYLFYTTNIIVELKM